MYIETRRPDGRIQSARIGRVSFSKTGKTIYYRGRSFQRIGRAEYLDSESGGHYWISGPRKDGNDRGANRSGSVPIEIDADVQREYWTEIRDEPSRVAEAVAYG